MALDRALLERMEQLLRELPTDGYPNLTKPELRELAAMPELAAFEWRDEFSALAAAYAPKRNCVIS